MRIREWAVRLAGRSASRRRRARRSWTVNHGDLTRKDHGGREPDRCDFHSEELVHEQIREPVQFGTMDYRDGRGVTETGRTAGHDGLHLQLWADGVLVDEELPPGPTRSGSHGHGVVIARRLALFRLE